MNAMSTLRPLRLAACGLFALLLAGAVSAAGAEVEVSIIKIKATGTPTGAPEIDEAIADLPAVPGLCRMYAKCTLESKTVKKTAFGEAVHVGSGGERISVAADRPGEDGRLPVAVTIGSDEKPCLSNTSTVKPGAPLVRFCEKLLPDGGTYIFVVTVQTS